MTEQPTIRYTPAGARACSAHTTAGKPCEAPAMNGQRICFRHGGSSPQAKRAARVRLAALADPAVERLAHELEHAEESRDRLAAANSILDRAGYGRSQTVTTEDARELLLQRLLEAQGDETP